MGAVLKVAKAKHANLREVSPKDKFLNHVNQETNLNSNSASNYLKIYLDFASFIGACPFRLKFVNKQFILRKLWYQKLASFIFTFFALLSFQATLRNYFPYGEKLDPTNFLRLMFGITTICIKTRTLKMFWKDAKKFQSICNMIELFHQESEYRQAVTHKSKISVKIKAILICLTYTTVVFMEILVGEGLRLNNSPTKDLSSNWGFNCWWAKIVESGHFAIFMVEQNDDQRSSKLESYLGDYIIGILTVFGFYTKRVLALYCDLLVLMVVLTLWTETKRILHTVVSRSEEYNLCQSVESPKWQGILRNFRYVQILANRINETIGLNVTLMLVETLLFYSTSFNQIFVETGGHQNYVIAGIMMFYTGNVSTIFALAADIPFMMQSVKEFLAIDGNRKGMPLDQLLLLLNDIEGASISIKGSGVFPIKYSTLANILGMTITYFIICLQT